MNLENRMNLADRDIYLIHIENEIEIRKKKLLEKQKKIHGISKQNHFLELVKEDYKKYYDIIIQQKYEQLKALEILKNYIHDLSVSGNLSKNNIKDGLYEQKKILHEIKKIKKGLDEIIQTNHQSILN
jgi:hypothetical protein